MVLYINAGYCFLRMGLALVSKLYIDFYLLFYVFLAVNIEYGFVFVLSVVLVVVLGTIFCTCRVFKYHPTNKLMMFFHRAEAETLSMPKKAHHH